MPAYATFSDSSTLQAAQRKLQRKMAEMQKKEYLPASMVAMVGRVAELQLTAEERVRFTSDAELMLPPELLATLPSEAEHLAGAVLLPGDQFPLDSPLAEELAHSILAVLTEEAPELALLALKLDASLTAGTYSLAEACRAALAQGRPTEDQTTSAGSYFSSWEQTHPEATGFFRFITQSAVMPSLAATRRLLGTRHNADDTWSHGFCPVCGNLPLIGRLKDAEGIRMHSCSFCSFEYRVPRVGCPFCLSAKQEHTEYHISDDEPGYLVEVCDTCKGYIKLADFRKLDKVFWAPFDDLESLTLDLYARRTGYVRPTLSAWGF